LQICPIDGEDEIECGENADDLLALIWGMLDEATPLPLPLKLLPRPLPADDIFLFEMCGDWAL